MLTTQIKIPQHKVNAAWYMGIFKSQPEPVIEHLVKGHSQPWEHRWKQFTCATRRGGPWVHSKACIPVEQLSLLGMSLV